jgi:multidrug efflux pump subunit AcrA (membrane-fusion protein)
MLAILLVVIILGLVFFIMANRRGPEPLPEEVIETITRMDVINNIALEGRIDPIRSQDISLPSGSKITEVRVEEGDRVDDNELLAKYETATGLGTKRNDLRAPLAGSVFGLNLTEDTIFLGTAPALTIIDGSEVIIKASVNENDVIDLSFGQHALFSLPALNDRRQFRADIASISQLPENPSGAVTYEVVLVPHELPEKLKLGMTVEFEVKVAEALDVIAIPESYIIERDGRFFVKKLKFLDEGRLEYELTQSEIMLGLRTDEFAEVTSGLSEGEQIVAPSFTPNRTLSLLGN